MILSQKSRDQFYSWYVKSNIPEVVVQKGWLSPFCYALFGLSRVNDDIIEAPIWVLEPAGNFIWITI